MFHSFSFSRKRAKLALKRELIASTDLAVALIGANALTVGDVLF